MEQVQGDCCDRDLGEEDFRATVISSCDEPPVFEPAEHDLDPVRLLYLRLSYLIGLSRDFRPEIQGLMLFAIKASQNYSVSYSRSPSNLSANSGLLTNALAPV